MDRASERGKIIMGRVHNFLNRLDKKYFLIQSTRNEKNKVSDPRRIAILKQVKLSKEQKKEIDKLYKDNYGKKIPYNWHRLYTSYTGIFDPRYIPELIYIPKIEAKFVKDEYAFLADKNLLPFIVGGIQNLRTASIYVSCVDGIYRDSENNIITFVQAVEIVYNIGDAFIKPTVDSNSGRGCSVLNIKNGKDQITGTDIIDILRNAGRNFNVQEKLVNCDSLKKLNSSSINTFRVTTYIWKNKLYHFPLILRIGRDGNALDNAHQGGMFIGVDDCGKLNNCAYTEFQERFTIHPDSLVDFSQGYVVPETPNIIKAAYSIHSRIPQVGMISWDLTVDNKGCVVLVEMNLKGQAIWVSQMANGKGAFGENTEEILRWIGNFNK